jgi:hypothetical protein
MKVVNSEILTVTLNDAGAVTDYGTAASTPVLVDLQAYPNPVEYNLVAKFVANGTAPGTTKTVTVNVYYSDVVLSAAGDALTSLSGRKFSATALTIANTASLTSYAKVVLAAGTIKPESRYIYVSVTSNAALAAGAEVVASLALVRQPGNRAEAGLS